MFISCTTILTFCFIQILAKPFRMEDRLPTTTRPTFERPDVDDPISPPPSSPPPPPSTPQIEGCKGEGCRPPPNLVAPIVGSLCGILVLAIIAVFIIWFYLRRKHKQIKKELPSASAPPVTYVEQPPLYTGAISTTDSTSRLYGKSLSQSDSYESHVYEKINYGEQT